MRTSTLKVGMYHVQIDSRNEYGFPLRRSMHQPLIIPGDMFGRRGCCVLCHTLTITSSIHLVCDYIHVPPSVII